MRRTAFLLILTVVACGIKKPSPASSNPEPASVSSTQPAKTSFVADVPVHEVPANFKPEDIELECGGNSCPAQVGALLFREAPGKYMRCTATLIAPTRVVTTGHCGYGMENGFFVSGIGAGRETRAIKGLVTRVFKPAPGGEAELRLPALAIFELDKPITSVTPMTIASGPQRLYDRLTAYVINDNSGKKGLRFRLDNVTCLVKRHEWIFPYNLSDSPDLIYGFDCKLMKGNSGAALVAPGSEEIQAVQQGIVDADEYALTVRAQFKRAPIAFENHDWVVATNVRCVAWDGHPAAACARAGEDEAAKHFDDLQKAMVKVIREREYVDAGSGLQFTARDYALKFDPNLYARSYDVIYLPECRTREFKEGETINLPNEYVRVDYDAWAAPDVSVLKTRMIPARITRVDATSVDLAPKWPALFAPPLDPDEHPSRRSSFQIALGLCQGY